MYKYKWWTYQGVLLFRLHTFFHNRLNALTEERCVSLLSKKSEYERSRRKFPRSPNFTRAGAGVATACRATVEGPKKANSDRCSATHRDARECRRGVPVVANGPSRLFLTLLQRAEETVAIRARRARIILDSQRRVSARSRCRREIVLARRVSRGGGA